MPASFFEKRRSYKILIINYNLIEININYNIGLKTFSNRDNNNMKEDNDLGKLTFDHKIGEGVYFFENNRIIGGLRILSICPGTVSIRFYDNREELNVKDYSLNKSDNERIQPIPGFYISVNPLARRSSKNRTSFNYRASQKYIIKRFP